MRSYRAPNATFDFKSRDGFSAYLPSSSSSCSLSGHNYSSTSSATCFPEAEAAWSPDLWSTAPEFVPTLPPGISQRLLARACDGVTVNVAAERWLPLVRTLYSSKYGPNSWTLLDGAADANAHGGAHGNASRRERKARCIERLSAFKPRVCKLDDVLVWGHAKRMMAANGSRYFLPPEVRGDQAAHDKACRANCEARPRNVVACGGRAVLGRNLMGVAYFHSLYEMLGSVAFAWEMLERDATASSPLRLLENMCIPADGSQMWMSMKSRVCAGGGFFGEGPAPFLSAMLGFAGLDVGRQLQHYPYVRQWDGPSIHLDSAIFDCSAANYRNFWHVNKLRSLLHARILLHEHRDRGRAANRSTSRASSTGAAAHAHEHTPMDAIVLMDRSECEGGGAAGAAGQQHINNKSSAQHVGARPPPVQSRCKRGRGVKYQREIRAALMERFQRQWRVLDFTGSEPYAEQAMAFHRAAVVVGPHGAQVANIIYCQRRASIVEFVATGRSNSALYAAYASSVFGLDYWAVVSNASAKGNRAVAVGSYDDIRPADVVRTVELALQKRATTRAAGAGSGPGAPTGLFGARRPAPPPPAATWHTLQGDEESNLVSGYGAYVNGWPAGW